MNSYKEKRALYYDEVIRVHYETGYGERRLSRIFPICHSTICGWIANFAQENNIDIHAPYSIYQSVMAKKLKKQETDPEVKALRAEVARLQTRAREAEMKAALCDRMIDLAETQFNIPIRKKSGAKR